MPKSKLSAFLSLLLVFLSGAVAGAFAHRLYMVNSVSSSNQQPPRRPDPEEVRRRIISDLKAKVHIDDEQAANLNKLMDETNQAWQQMRHKMNLDGRAIHDHQWQAFRATLRADQQVAYDQWLAERDAEMKKRQQERDSKKGSGPPRP